MAASNAIPPTIQRALERGRKQMRANASRRRLCMRFERGDTYWFINGKNVLDFQSTVTTANGGHGKPPHRIRNTYNFIRPIVEAKVSAATQRIPSYDITPASSDPQTIAAAGLSERVALYGYDQWRLRDVSIKTVKLAIAGGGAGFAMPYFDPNVGPYTQVGNEWVGRGEIKVLVLNGNEVYWEAGCDFNDSRWYAIERARSIDDVKETPGFIQGEELAPDASTSDIPNDRDGANNLVMVTEYFERPCPKYPDGRCLTIANGRPIVDYRFIDPAAPAIWGPYPLQDTDGTVLDEPILHRLVYTHNQETDDDFGLVWQLIDFQRTAQDCYNKILEHKNRVLNPQMMAPVGSLISQPDDVPGAIRYYRPIGGQAPVWEQPPPVPGSLFQILERTVEDMRAVAADLNVDPAPNLAARTLQAGIEQSQNRWQSFLGDLAEWHSRLMRHCLMLTARYYTEPRLLEIRGLEGWESLSGFKGAHLMGQTSVRVLPNSLQPITRQGIQEKLTWINQNWPGFLSPEAALATLDSGSVDKLTQSYWLAVGRASSIIQKIRDGTVFEMPDRTEMQPVPLPDGSTTMQEMTVPAFMPNDVDNLSVWKQVFSNFMQSDSFERLDQGFQAVANEIWAGLDQLEMRRAQKKAQMEMQFAQQQGMGNAARPQMGMTSPSLPGSGQTPPSAAVATLSNHP